MFKIKPAEWHNELKPTENELKMKICLLTLYLNHFNENNAPTPTPPAITANRVSKLKLQNPDFLEEMNIERKCRFWISKVLKVIIYNMSSFVSYY